MKVRSNTGAIASGALRGASALSFLGPYGAALGAVGGGVMGALANKKAKEEEMVQKRAELATMQRNSQDILAQYPSYGYKKGGKWKYPAGGTLPYPTTEDAEYEVLSSDMIKYDGKNHSQGGIPLDTNQDGRADIEVEDDEVIKDNIVYSDRLKPSEGALSKARNFGLHIKEDDSFASIAERLGRKKKLYEDKLNSSLSHESTTGKIMLERVDETLNDLFNDQQIQNGNSMGEGMKYGGIFKKRYPGGGEIPENVILAYQEQTRDQGTEPLVGLEEDDPLFYDKDSFSNYYKTKAIDKLTPQDRELYETSLESDGQAAADAIIALRGGIPDYKIYKKLIPNSSSSSSISTSSSNRLPSYGGSSVGGYRYSARRGRGLPAKGSITRPMYNYGGKMRYVDGGITDLSELNTEDLTKIKFDKDPLLSHYNNSTFAIPNEETPQLRGLDIGDYRGDIANATGFLTNQAQIAGIETGYTPTLTPNPTFNYRSRVPFITSEFDKNFQTATQGVGGSSAQDNLALRSNIYAKTLQGRNHALDSEFGREDAYRTNFANLSSRVGLYNTSETNRARLLSLQGRNEKRALTQANIDSLFRGVIGNEAQRDLQQTDFIKSYLNFAKEGNTGVATRLINQLPARVRRKIGFE